MIIAVGDTARRHGPAGVGTVGLVECRPNSRNVIPGTVFFSIDFRHPEDSVVAAMEAEMRKAVADIAAAAGVDGRGRARLGFAGGALQRRLHRRGGARGDGAGLSGAAHRVRSGP